VVRRRAGLDMRKRTPRAVGRSGAFDDLMVYYSSVGIGPSPRDLHPLAQAAWA